MRRLATVSALLLLSSAAAAQQVLPVPNPAIAPKPGEKPICKSIETLGSRLSTKKQCLTASQWRQLQRDQADDIDKRLRAPHSEASGG